MTVDPHKLGFVPFGAGALVVRDRRVLDLVQQEAPYVFTSPAREDERRYRKLGRYILEGSKPGAAAAACYVNHRVLPLDHDHFGRLMSRSVQTCERLVGPAAAASAGARSLGSGSPSPSSRTATWSALPSTRAGTARCRPPTPSAASSSRRIDVRPDQPVQLKEFFGSCDHDSARPPRARGARANRRRAAARPSRARRRRSLPAPAHPDEPVAAERHQDPGEPSYVEAYCHFLVRQVKALLGSA